MSELDETAKRLTWAQQLEGTPFARIMRFAETELQLESIDGGTATEVTIVLNWEPPALAQSGYARNGLFARLGSFMVRRANGATLKEALDGLERIAG